LGHVRWAAAVREKLAGVLLHTARYDDALEALRRALATYRGEQDLPAVVRTVARAGEVHVLHGTPQEGLALLQSELTLPLAGTEHETSVDLAPAYIAWAWLLNACGRYVEALPVATLAASLAREQEDTAAAIQAELRRSQLLLMLGKLDDGMSLLRAVIPLAKAADDLRSLRLALNSLGWAHEARGEFEQDALYTEQAFAAAQQRGDPNVVAFMTSNRGGPAINLGRWRRARQTFEAGLALMRPLATTLGLSPATVVAGTAGACRSGGSGRGSAPEGGNRAGGRERRPAGAAVGARCPRGTRPLARRSARRPRTASPPAGPP
jgi:tetratricopeptide (TPR) repeat protein